MACPVFTQADTQCVPPPERIEYWNAYNREALVALRSSSLSDEGLVARQVNRHIGDIGLADIEGNDHLVERGPMLVRDYPKESIFVAAITRGKAQFIQNGESLLIEAGELIVYDTRTPFLLIFLTPMCERLMDIPLEAFVLRTGLLSARLPVRLKGDSSVSRLLLGVLGRLLDEGTQASAAEPDTALAGVIYETLGALLRPPGSVEGGAPTQVSRLLAKRFVQEQLGDPQLTPALIARAVGLSLRQLNRVFEQEGASPARYLWEQRALRAHADLCSPRFRHLSLSEIAFACGYSSQAHFSRAMKKRFGDMPSAIREHHYEVLPGTGAG